MTEVLEITTLSLAPGPSGETAGSPVHDASDHPPVGRQMTTVLQHGGGARS
jgi:hypothetical protein